MRTNKGWTNQEIWDAKEGNIGIVLYKILTKRPHSKALVVIHLEYPGY
jgi:hypothetical protein